MLVAFVALPGYFISVCFANRLGFRTIQLQGFASMTLLFGVLGLAYRKLLGIKTLALVLYSLTFFFLNGTCKV